MRLTAFGRQHVAELSSGYSVVGMLAARLFSFGRGSTGNTWFAGDAEQDINPDRAQKVGRRSKGGRPSRRIRQSWARALVRMGREEVRYAFETVDTMQLSGAERVVFVDTGLTNGADRYPTRLFVQDWLGEGLDAHEQGLWRIRLVVVFAFAAMLALVLGVAGG